nr:endonuclease III [candidate division Zixibacteria bacterium]
MKENPDRTKKIIARLKKAYPDARCTLDFKTPHQLLVATILSAQCTDERVNIVTRDLFKKYKTPEDFARADIKEIEQDIRSTGFFRNKARSIKESAKALIESHNGRMPETMDQLVQLAGVGRKTASVILGAAFNKAEGIVVDTHVARLSQRLGFTTHKDPIKIERDLMTIIPEKDWIIIAQLLIDHGRAVCRARRPDCDNCILAEYCPSAHEI